MAGSGKFQTLISVLIMIQLRDLSAEKMIEAPGFSDSDTDTDNMEKQAPVIVNLDEEQFMNFVQSPKVRMVYFDTGLTTEQMPKAKELSGVQIFLKALKSSAVLLEPFGVKVGKVNCRRTKVPDYCSRPDVQNSVFAFKSGGELLQLQLVNMFDVNSIMSNVLQLVLLKEVPILQTKAERLTFEEQNKGKSDVIFTYQRSIGTREHRILMELAHGYTGEYAFALTTEEEVIEDLPDRLTNEKEDVAIWFGRCSDAEKDSSCEYTKYFDTMDRTRLSSYFGLLNVDLLRDIGSNKMKNPFADLNIHMAVLYYDKASKERVINAAKEVNAAFPGSVGVICVDLDNVDGARFGFVKDLTTVPGLVIFMDNEQRPHHLETPLTGESAIRFIKAELEFYARQGRKKSHARNVDSDEENENPSEHDYTDEDEASDDLSAVEKQDDSVAEAVYQLRETPINRDHIPALTDKTFPQEIGSRDILMVLFYVSFDSRSMAFMRSYSEAAESLAKDGIEPLASLECYDWTDVCAKQNITTYPTIRIYQKGQGYTTYDGPLESKAVMKKIKLLVSPAPVHLQTEDEVSKFIEGHFPSALSTVTPVSILGLYSKEHTAELQAFKDASLALHGKQLMGHAADELTEKLLKSYSMNGPGFVVFNREDPYKPHRVSQGAMNVDEILTKISDAVLPVLPQLTALNFPTYFAMGQPLVVLFAQGTGAEQEKEIMKTMSELALDKGNLKVVYCWMPVDDKDPIDVGMNVLLHYNSAAVAPALSIVNHALGNIYNYPASNFEKENILQWVKSVVDGRTKPSKMLDENEWKPLNPGYDFLGMMDDEMKQDTERVRFRKGQHDKGSDSGMDDPIEHDEDDDMYDDTTILHNDDMAAPHDDDMAALHDGGPYMDHHTEL